MCCNPSQLNNYIYIYLLSFYFINHGTVLLLLLPRVPGEALEKWAQEDVPSAANDYGRLRIVPRFQENGGGHEGGRFEEQE